MKVKAYVYVVHNGSTIFLRPGDTVPAGVTVTNPDVIEAEAKILPAPAPEKDEAGEKAAPAKRTPRKATAKS
jgi:hypothetical protein